METSQPHKTLSTLQPNKIVTSITVYSQHLYRGDLIKPSWLVDLPLGWWFSWIYSPHAALLLLPQLYLLFPLLLQAPNYPKELHVNFLLSDRKKVGSNLGTISTNLLHSWCECIQTTDIIYGWQPHTRFTFFSFLFCYVDGWLVFSPLLALFSYICFVLSGHCPK